MTARSPGSWSPANPPAPTTTPTTTTPATDGHDRGGVATWLRAAATRLPPVLARAPTQPLALGRTSRVVQAAQRVALAICDPGWVFPDCARPPAWCQAHHLQHWVHGGPPTWPTWPWSAGPITGRSMRAAGGWAADPTAASPPPHRPHPHRQHPTAA